MLFLFKHVKTMQISQMLDRAKIILLLEIKTFFCRKLISREVKQHEYAEQDMR